LFLELSRLWNEVLLSTKVFFSPTQPLGCVRVIKCTKVSGSIWLKRTVRKKKSWLTERNDLQLENLKIWDNCLVWLRLTWNEVYTNRVVNHSDASVRRRRKFCEFPCHHFTISCTFLIDKRGFLSRQICPKQKNCRSLFGSFCGAFCGAEACRAKHRKMPRGEHRKRIAPQKSKLGLPNYSQLVPAISLFSSLRPYYDWNVFNNTWIRCFYHNMAVQKSPERAGISMGVWVLIFAGQFFLWGSPRVILRGLALQALAPQKALQKEPSWRK